MKPSVLTRYEQRWFFSTRQKKIFVRKCKFFLLKFEGHWSFTIDFKTYTVRSNVHSCYCGVTRWGTPNGNRKVVFYDHFAGDNFSLKFITYDLSIGSTETKYIKLNSKTQFFFITFDFCIHFKRENFFLLLFSYPPLSKCIEKLSNFHFKTKNILGFSI